MEQLVTSYNENLAAIVDRHAPLCTRTITLRPGSPWYNEEIRDLKHEKRKWEKKWRQTKLVVHRDIFYEVCQREAEAILQAKGTYLSGKVNECGRDRKQLFRVAKSLLGEPTEPTLPTHESKKDLSDRFSRYFVDKISTIRQSITSTADSINVEYEQPFVGTALNSFVLTTEEEVARLLARAPNKSSELDPIPTWLLKKVAVQLVPLMTAIFNKSLESSSVPSSFKHALVRPLLKKPGLDADNLKNYRPVSNLPFIAKCLERIVCERIESHIQMNQLHEPMQSAYRRCHSTETALLKVQGDILDALDQGCYVALVLLDLSAAFDTIEHSVLIKRLEHTHGIKDTALDWMRSYFQGRTQAVVISGTSSDITTLERGVPQGSVIGPKGYSIHPTTWGHSSQASYELVRHLRR